MISTLAKHWPGRLRRPFRFGLVGIANTITGLAVIFAGLAIGLGDVPANVLGYAVGLSQGFILNRRWTFQSGSGALRAQVVRYLMAFVPAYGINILIVMGFVSAGVVKNPLTHLAGNIAYTITFYLLCAHFVFRADGAGPKDRGAAGPATLQDLAGLTLDARRRLLSSPLVRRWYPEALAGLALVALYAGLWNMRVTYDVTWQYWLARQMLHGARLYIDLFEVNPPMWFWSAMPLEAFAEFAGLPTRNVAVASGFVFVAASVALLAALLRTERVEKRAAALLLACVVMIIVPITDFGQREHFALIGALPYAVLIARRAEGRPTSTALALLVGLIAAYGFSLKHYFVVVPALLELWLVLFHRANWRPVRAETIVLAGFAMLYGIAFWLLTPAYFTNLLPLVRLVYGVYGLPFTDMLLIIWTPFWLLGAIALMRVRHSLPPIVIAVGLATLGFVITYFIQQKGWRYHSLAGAAAMAFATGLATIYWRHGVRSFRRHPGVPATCVMIVAIGVILGPYTNPHEKITYRAMATAQPGDSVALFAVDATLVWPMIDEASLLWPHRYYTYWMIPALAQAERDAGPSGLSPEMQALSHKILRDTAEDLWCHPPTLILVDDTRRSKSMSDVTFDILTFFKRDPAVDALLKHYRQTNVAGRLTVYSKADDLTTPMGMKCRPTVTSR